jgi:hypothetical protein
MINEWKTCYKCGKNDYFGRECFNSNKEHFNYGSYGFNKLKKFKLDEEEIIEVVDDKSLFEDLKRKYKKVLGIEKCEIAYCG